MVGFQVCERTMHNWHGQSQGSRCGVEVTQRRSLSLSPSLLRVNVLALPRPRNSPCFQENQAPTTVWVRRMGIFWVGSTLLYTYLVRGGKLAFKSFTHSLLHSYLCIFPTTPSSPTVSSLKFLLHHKHILLKNRSRRM